MTSEETIVNDIHQRVRTTVSRIMGVPAETVVDESSPDSIGTWDSLAHMKLVLALEEEFGIRFTDDQIMAMPTVGRIIGTVDVHLR
jgi:acyl carrier protein